MKHTSFPKVKTEKRPKTYSTMAPMSGEQKLKDELEKAVWHRDCTARIAKNIAKNVDSLKSENAALKAALAELIPIAELFARRVSLDPKEVSSYGEYKAVIDRAKKLLDKQPQSESDKTE